MDLKIWEATGHPAEARVATLVRTWVSQGKIKPYLFTGNIVVARHVIPHSHPTLTLNTRWVGQPNRVLAQLLHEEWHWWAANHHAWTTMVCGKFQAQYPNLPTFLPRGADGLESTYLHVLICALEYFAITVVLGTSAAAEVLQQNIEGDHYTAIYSLVDHHKDSIALTLMDLGAGPLLPMGLLAWNHER